MMAQHPKMADNIDELDNVEQGYRGLIGDEKKQAEEQRRASHEAFVPRTNSRPSHVASIKEDSDADINNINRRPSMSKRISVAPHQASLNMRPDINRLKSMATFGEKRKSSFEATGSEPEVCYWMPPPPEDFRENVLTVDFRCACFKLTEISTVFYTALVKFVVVFEWNDPRLKSMSITTNDLPNELWGPDVILENAQCDCDVNYDSFSLLDCQTGRLRRTVTFHGYVYNPMDLIGFPFDTDDLEMKFISICNWRTLDGSRHGNDPCNKVYKLRPMENRPGVGFFFLGWDGNISEFEMLGWKKTVTNNVDNPEKPIIFQFDIHLARKAHFYILKVLLPLWIIILTSLAVFGIEVDDFQGRLEVIFTLLLSTIALLYVVQESIPKISFLTDVDKVVIATLSTLALQVLFSWIIKQSPNPESMNHILAVVNQAVYWTANILVLLPPYLKYRTHRAKLEAEQQEQEDNCESNKRPSFGRTRKTYSFLTLALDRSSSSEEVER